MRLRDRLQKLEGQSGYQRTVLVCPECGEEFVVHGDVAVEYIVHGWAKGNGGQGYHKTQDDLLRVFKHEHDPDAFIEKRSGLPFLSREVSGLNFGGTIRDA